MNLYDYHTDPAVLIGYDTRYAYLPDVDIAKVILKINERDDEIESQLFKRDNPDLLWQYWMRTHSPLEENFLEYFLSHGQTGRVETYWQYDDYPKDDRFLNYFLKHEDQHSLLKWWKKFIAPNRWKTFEDIIKNADHKTNAANVYYSELIKTPELITKDDLKATNFNATIHTLVMNILRNRE